MKTEVESNWSKAYTTEREEDASCKENIISSHFVFKVKKEEDGSRRFKARLSPHGNRVRINREIRKDSATAQFDIIRIILSMVAILGFRIGVIDMKEAYLQSEAIRRLIYVRPPADILKTRGVLWRLK